MWQGRSGELHSPIMGGHAKGFNTHSVGVALLGQHQPGAAPSAVSPSAAAMTALRDVLAWKLAAHNVNPQATIPIVSQGSPKYPEGRTVHLPTIQGHRDSGLTSCPGELTYSRLAQLRTQVADRIAATRSPSRWSPATTGPAFFGRIVNQAAGRPLPNGVPGRSTSRVVRGGQSRDGIAYEITFAAGTDIRIGSVDRLYRAAFVRWPDAPGLRFWVGQRDAGRSVMSIARAFADSSEFRSRYDALDDRAFVDAIYRNVLGRGADQAGSDHWTGRLDAGLQRYELLAHFSESGEHKLRTNRQTGISRAYYVLVVRAPSASDRTFWEGQLAAGRTGRDPVSALLRSSEYAAGQ